MQYTVTEKQNMNSYRDGELVEARNLADAKRKASRMQSFQGTVLEISDTSGPICYKENGKWKDA